VYALACIEVWRKRAEELTLTYFYLDDAQEVARPAGDPDETRGRVLKVLEGMAAADFAPTPGPQCRWCDFLAFCDPGAAYVASAGDVTVSRRDEPAP
jgi:hypothetical protein